MSSDGGSAGRRCSCSDEAPCTRTRAVVEGGGAVAVVVAVVADVAVVAVVASVVVDDDVVAVVAGLRPLLLLLTLTLC